MRIKRAALAAAVEQRGNIAGCTATALSMINYCRRIHTFEPRAGKQENVSSELQVGAYALPLDDYW